MSPVPTGPHRRPNDTQVAPRMILTYGVSTHVLPLPAITPHRRGISRNPVAVVALAATSAIEVYQRDLNGDDLLGEGVNSDVVVSWDPPP